MIVCPKCSHENPEGTQVCWRCGRENLGGSEEQGTGGPVTETPRRKRRVAKWWAVWFGVMAIVGIWLFFYGYFQTESWACQGRAECGLGQNMILIGLISSLVGAAGLISVGIAGKPLNDHIRRESFEDIADPCGIFLLP